MKNSNNNHDRLPATDEPVVDLLDRWNAVPRDGPAVFVIGGDSPSCVMGDWIDPTAATEQVADAVAVATGQPPEIGSWAVVDQTGLGAELLPEHLSIESLVRIARARRSER
jgi:hypothetical protein